jgi:hypothetical protein
LADLRQVAAAFADVLPVFGERLLELPLKVDARVAGLRQAVDVVR